MSGTVSSIGKGKLRKAVPLLLAFTMLVFALYPIAPVRAAPNAFQLCDVFASLGSDSQIAWWRPNQCGIPTSMTLQGILDAPGITGTAGGGMAFNVLGCALGPGNPCLYATEFQAQTVAIFDDTGTFLRTCGTGYNFDPESIVVNTASIPGAIYVGQADGTHEIRKFNLDCSNGTPPFFAPATELRGTDWIDLVAPDSSDGGSLCDMQYTSESAHILTFDVCSNTQEANLNPAPLPGSNAFAHRQLTIDESVLVGDDQFVVHLDGSGNVISTCDSSNGVLFALNLLPGSTAFVTADLIGGKTDYFTIAHCDARNTVPDFTFNAIPAGCAGTAPCVVAGLAVFGEATVVTPGLDSTSTSVSCAPSIVAVNQATQCTAFVTDTSATPSSPTGTVTFSSNRPGRFTPSRTCNLRSISSSSSSCSVIYTPSLGTEGTHTITAGYSGDSTHRQSTGYTTISVTKRSSVTSVTCSPSTTQARHPVTCTATVADTSPGTPITPTGTVAWGSTGPGSFSSASCTLSSTGPSTASCTVNYTPTPAKPSLQTITGTYSGDTDHAGSSGSTTINIL